MLTPYEDLLRRIVETGTIKGDRTGTGTISLVGQQLRYNLSEVFPLVTTKLVGMRLVVGELLWFLSGESNIKALTDSNINIWNEWARKDGELGPIYGVQWRSWPAPDGKKIDQIARLVDTIRTDPDSRRMIVSAWNVADLADMALEPCHMMFQIIITDGKLNCIVTQRSADMLLGVPFNLASYALLTHMLAQQTGYEVGELVWNGGDCHIYLNHLEQVHEQLSRDPYKMPTLDLNKASSIDDYTPQDVVIENYKHHPAIKAPIAV